MKQLNWTVLELACLDGCHQTKLRSSLLGGEYTVAKFQTGQNDKDDVTLEDILHYLHYEFGRKVGCTTTHMDGPDVFDFAGVFSKEYTCSSAIGQYFRAVFWK